MHWLNGPDRYGVIPIALHWVTAVAVVALFAAGLYMVELDYYHPWYNALPHWHRSIGLLLAMLVLLRLVVRACSRPPEPMVEHSAFERVAAPIAHAVLYLLLLAMFASGYLLSTAEGRGIAVFNWFEVPAATGPVDGMEDSAGEVHEWVAWSLIVLAGGHALAALKHHFIDKDRTLMRMLGRSSK
ncbi:cytochrome b [Marinobacteraceae bacterium S3BR75-40.1]